MAGEKTAPPATLVIFGAGGDLTRRLLVPSLIHMMAAGMIDDQFSVLGVSRSEMSDAEFRQSLEDFDAGETGAGYAKAWRKLRGKVHYMAGDVTDSGFYTQLDERLEKDGADNAVFYLAISPSLFEPIIDGLGEAGLFEKKGAFRRLAVEKPFGHNAASAKALNAKILRWVDENDTYRIDHFLGKETVQNIMVARFANAMIEAVWNRQYIDNVQITVAETVDVGTRGEFFDATGTLRDMVPNHLFQILAMTAMEPPNRFDAASIREAKSQLLDAIRIPNAKDVKRDTVRGVYTAGNVGGNKVAAYAKADGVASDSRTETYAALKLEIDNWRWAGIPFYLRTGKAMSHKDSEVVVTFKPVPYADFRDAKVGTIPGNRLVLQLQPDEGISLDFMAKKPGAEIEPTPVAMQFSYADYFELGGSTGYETLIYDILTGDQTLFQRADAVEAAWRIVDPITKAWKSGKPETYRAGSAGPKAADGLLERDGRQWHALGR
ncbi:MAG: glucose-6-phosphate dehydrogenase [Sphingomonadaceae bacterium]